MIVTETIARNGAVLRAAEVFQLLDIGELFLCLGLAFLGRLVPHALTAGAATISKPHGRPHQAFG